MAELDGVKFYNDSKSTTAESVAVAVSAFRAEFILLPVAGTRDAISPLSMNISESM